MLSDPVHYQMQSNFRQQLASAPQSGMIVVELTTLRGDPEVARISGEDVRFQSEKEPEALCLARQGWGLLGRYDFDELLRPGGPLTCPRYRTMIHVRRIDKPMHNRGPLSTCAPKFEAALNEMKAFIVIQN